MRRLRLFVLLLLSPLLACTAATPAVVPLPIINVATPLPTPTNVVTAVPPTRSILKPTVSPVFVPTPTVVAGPSWQNPVDEAVRQTAVRHNVPFYQVLPENSGVWQYAPGSFLHPIALAANERTAFLLDGGRVLALNLQNGLPPGVVLQPGAYVENLLVQEPLDLALVDGSLLVLERAGDVYAFEAATAVWRLERFERPIGETSSHYYVALGHDAAVPSMRLRLETSYGYAQYYSPDGRPRSWNLPEMVLPVDVSGLADVVYTLWRNADGTASVMAYQETRHLAEFAPTVTMMQPRQIVATEAAVYVLDAAGRRLLSLQPQTGELQAVFLLPDVTTFAANRSGNNLLFAGRDRLFFWQRPEQSQFIQGGPVLTGLQPHDTAVWQISFPYSWPISGNANDLTSRDLQMPGAPRHYRLGVHEGTDFYWAKGTPVYAAASGTVIRAAVDYEAPTETSFNRRRAENIELGYTAPDNLDFYRGRQIWILQGDGFVARYAHLSEIAEGIVEGTAVTAGQRIGSIGNSGSPASIDSETADAHLHFELWLDNVYLGQFLRPIETRELLEQLFSP